MVITPNLALAQEAWLALLADELAEGKRARAAALMVSGGNTGAGRVKGWMRNLGGLEADGWGEGLGDDWDGGGESVGACCTPRMVDRGEWEDEEEEEELEEAAVEKVRLAGGGICCA